MKIVIMGKGGCGKSTVSSILAKGLSGKGHSVLVVDIDESNFGLHRQLGLDEPKELMEHMGGKKEMGGRIMGAMPNGEKVDLLKSRFNIDDIPSHCLSSKDGVMLLQIGKVKHFGEGCACPMGTLSRVFLENLVLRKGEVVIVDTEAGVEHVGRGVERAADLVLMVLDPSFESLRLKDKVTVMMEEAGKPFFVVLNRVRPEYEGMLVGRCEPNTIAAVLPEDTRVNQAGFLGEETPLDVQGAEVLLNFICGKMDG